MAPPSPHPVQVFAAGAALSLASVACADKGPASPVEPAPPDTRDLPPEERDDAVLPPTNPPPPEQPPATSDGPAVAADLPRWEDVSSSHPPGATNPPVPVLEVTADGTRCFKAWQSPMMRDPALLAVGGRVLASAAAAQGTEVACDPAKAAALLERHTKHQAADAPPGPTRSGK